MAASAAAPSCLGHNHLLADSFRNALDQHHDEEAGPILRRAAATLRHLVAHVGGRMSCTTMLGGDSKWLEGFVVVRKSRSPKLVYRGWRQSIAHHPDETCTGNAQEHATSTIVIRDGGARSLADERQNNFLIDFPQDYHGDVRYSDPSFTHFVHPPIVAVPFQFHHDR